MPLRSAIRDRSSIVPPRYCPQMDNPRLVDPVRRVKLAPAQPPARPPIRGSEGDGAGRGNPQAAPTAAGPSIEGLWPVGAPRPAPSTFSRDRGAEGVGPIGPGTGLGEVVAEQATEFRG